MRLLLVLLALGLTVYALIDCLRTPSTAVQHLPKTGWVLLVVVVWVIGPVLWLVAGRPRSTPTRPTGPAVPPDDDPDFLRSL